MAHALKDFLNAANSNTIRSTNQYEIEIQSGYSDIDEVLQTAAMFGQNFTLPNRTLEFASVHYKGAEFGNLVPTTMKWETDHAMTVIADVNGDYRRAFLAWQGKVINPDISGGSKFEGERQINDQSIIRIRLFDSDNETVIETYKFYNVKIASVGGISLQYEGGDKATFEVGFKSTYWEIEKAEKGKLTNQK